MNHRGLQCFAYLTSECFLWVGIMCEQVMERSLLCIEKRAAGEQELLMPQMMQRAINDHSGSHMQVVDAMLICSDCIPGD